MSRTGTVHIYQRYRKGEILYEKGDQEFVVYGLDNGVDDNQFLFKQLITDWSDGVPVLVRVYDGTFFTKSDHTFPSNVSWLFSPNAKLKPDTGKTITIQGAILGWGVSAASDIATGDGTVTASNIFTANPTLQQVLDKGNTSTTKLDMRATIIGQAGNLNADLLSNQGGPQVLILSGASPQIIFEDTNEGAGDKVIALYNNGEVLEVASLTDDGSGFDVSPIFTISRDGPIKIGQAPAAGVNSDEILLWNSVSGEVKKRPPDLKTAKVTLSQNGIQNLNSSPIEAISAPGAGNIIEVVSASARYNHNGTDYVGSGGSDGSLYLRYNSSNDIIRQFATSLITSTSSQGTFLQGTQLAKTAIANIENQPVQLYAQNDFTGAGGTIEVWISYRVVN